MNYINTWKLSDIQAYVDKNLKDYKGLEVIDFSIAGIGNMNYTYRAMFKNNNSLIIKQAPPFAAKFPSIEAPLERAYSEFFYYKLINSDSVLSGYSPQVFHFDSSLNIITMTDLGDAKDFETIYSDGVIDKESILKLTEYLSKLHNIKVDEEFDNSKMRELNFSYIFDLPFKSKEGVINLDEIANGLSQLDEKLLNNKIVLDKVKDLGELYLNNSLTLIHGDYYPKSWVKSEEGFFIIDPEFAFVGIPEFDLGVMLAHLMMAEQNRELWLEVLENYKTSISFSWELVHEFAAVEILRRLLFVAQLPLKNCIEFKTTLYQKAVDCLEGKGLVF